MIKELTQRHVYHNNGDKIDRGYHIHRSSCHQIHKITPTVPETRIVIYPQMRNIDLLSNLPGLLYQTAQFGALHVIWYGMNYRT